MAWGEAPADDAAARPATTGERTPAPADLPAGFDTVLVIDFGAQYGQLIARRVRELNVYSELIAHDTPVEKLHRRRPAGIILSGGPASVYVDDAPRVDPGLFELGVPVLGICYGHQYLAREMGGTVARTGTSEFGKTTLSVSAAGAILEGLEAEEQCWMSHRDGVTEVPEGFDLLAASSGAPVAAMEDRGRGFYGVQFHPEVVHTPRGMEVLANFLFTACGCTPSWTPASIIEEQVRRIREQVGDGRAILGLSGGVDSSVAALLVHKAIGEQLTCVFIDQGMMRLNESEQVVEMFAEHFDVPLIAVDASDRFLKKLVHIVDPERKRKIIGTEFIRCFEEEASKIEGARFLVQGTLYSDVIESGTRQAAKIKSHHNVGGLPEKMGFELVEPLRELFKDEVRAVGEELGLPERIVWRQPFPGPGLGIRIIGEITRDRVDILQRADAILLEEIRAAGLYRELWQSFAVLPVVRSVGVQGDERTYGYPIVIRAVTSKDAMTADWAKLPYDLLERISNRIINEVPEVNRVVLDISSKPPSTIEWE
ncbi:MAG: glutamine-hydrolyzing GMP synthase [Actinobacteria bacterium]|nr:glutamine-hydrolyzing GMP synthase [Actinomycetota bacterium]